MKELISIETNHLLIIFMSFDCCNINFIGFLLIELFTHLIIMFAYFFPLYTVGQLFDHSYGLFRKSTDYSNTDFQKQSVVNSLHVHNLQNRHL